MNNHITENEEIAAYCRELKLPTFKEGLDDVIAEATEQCWSYRRFLLENPHETDPLIPQVIDPL